MHSHLKFRGIAVTRIDFIQQGQILQSEMLEINWPFVILASFPLTNIRDPPSVSIDPGAFLHLSTWKAADMFCPTTARMNGIKSKSINRLYEAAMSTVGGQCPRTNDGYGRFFVLKCRPSFVKTVLSFCPVRIGRGPIASRSLTNARETHAFTLFR